MQAIGMCAALRRIVRFSRNHKACLYYAACICLLVAAAGLRFHDLSEKSLRFDEAVTANNSRGTLSEVVSGTRCCNSNPILYPLVLYAVQKVESTIFSVRIVPATASVLTIALMLFFLPRLGVARGAAFLAALLATLSVEAIRHAQDVREYSIDALVALLMVAGLLRYLRDGRKALLCVSLFLAPLLQYGLVLFGAAVIGAALVAPRVSAQERRSAHPGRIGDWLKRRLDLAAPCGFFLAGGALSYLMTLRYQWQEGGFASGSYLSGYYYQEKFDAYSIFEFSIDGIWSLLKYHLPEVVAIAALPAFAILLVAAFLRKFQDGAIAVLFSFCIAVSVGAAVLGIYPLGDIRQSIYLGPVIFLAVGLAFHSGADALASTARQAWLGPLLIVLSVSAIVLSGVDAIRRIDLYRPHEKGEEILSVLQEHAQEDDVLYYHRDMREVIEFHGKLNRGRLVFDGKVYCWYGEELCLQEMIDEITPWIGRNRLWLVSRYPRPYLRMTQTMTAHVPVEHVVSGGTPNLYLIEDAKSLIQIATATDMFRDIKPILPREPSIRSTFDIYLRGNTLVYFKEPCGAEYMRATFFLHYEPVVGDDLPADRQQYGFDGVHFNIQEMPVEQCVALQELPDYAIALIRTGQFLGNEDGSYANLWVEELRFDE